MVSRWLKTLNPRFAAAMLLSLYVGLSIVGVGVVSWFDLQDTYADTERSALFGAHLLENHVEEAVSASDLLIRAAAVAVHQNRLSNALPYLAVQMQALPSALNLYVFSANATFVGSVVADDLDPSLIQQQEWWQVVRQKASADLYVGREVYDSVHQGYVIPVARQIVAPDGAALGYCVVLLRSKFFQTFQQQANLGESPVIGIHHQDGHLILRYPLRDDLPQLSLGEAALFTKYLPHSPTGTFHGQVAANGQQGVFSYRKLPQHKLVVWVSALEDEPISAWMWRSGQLFLLMMSGQICLVGVVYRLFREMRQERKSTAQLVELNRNLARSNADLEQFAYIASHDLKEPLRNISSYVQLLQRRYEGRLDADADAFIGYTVDGVRRLQTIINELLAYSRIGTGEINAVPVQAGMLVGSALSNLKGAIADAQAVIEVKGTLPVVVVDVSQLGSLFQNLIGNAIKYRSDDVRTEVEIGCIDRGGDWAFYVKDNGIGIDPQYQQQIFGLFKRLHTREQFQGTGIGLSVCQRVVERHGGHIWVESTLGHGATFWFTLPKKQSN